MKRSLFFLMVLCLLAAGTAAYAGVDGIWMQPSENLAETFGAMVMVINGTMYFAVLPLEMGSWLPYAGPFDGTTAFLSQWFNQRTFGGTVDITMPQFSTATFTLTSPATATIMITGCADFPQQNNCAPVGTVLNITKIR